MIACLCLKTFFYCSDNTTLSTDEDEFHLAVLLSEQESEFGVNMLEAIVSPEDLREVEMLTATLEVSDCLPQLVYVSVTRLFFLCCAQLCSVYSYFSVYCVVFVRCV